METFMKFIFLGTGTSVGIPSLGMLGWGRCDPNNIKNKRQRCSLLLQYKGLNVLIDAGPDIRNQLLQNNISKIDAVLITHEHADHIAGLDELRPFYFPKKEKINLYTNKQTANILKKRFDYLFYKQPGSQNYFIPPLYINEINFYDEFNIEGLNVKTLKQNHGVMDTIGFIFNDKYAYCTDVVKFPKKSFDKLYDLELLIISGLREKPHIAHAHFDLTFKWIKELNPKSAYLTHFSPDSDHDYVKSICPKGSQPAYDGLKIEYKL